MLDRMRAEPSVPISPAVIRLLRVRCGMRPSKRPAPVSSMALRQRNPPNPRRNGRATRGTTPACRSITTAAASSAVCPTVPNILVSRRSSAFSTVSSKRAPTLDMAEVPNRMGRTFREDCQTGTAVLLTSTPVYVARPAPKTPAA